MTTPAPAPARPPTSGSGTRVRPFQVDLLRVVPATRWPVLALTLVGVAQGVVAIGQAVAVAAVVVAVVRQAPLAPVLAPAVGMFLARGVLTAAAERVGAWAGVTVSTVLRQRATAVVLGRPADAIGDPAAVRVLLDQGATAVEPYVARYLPTLVGAIVLPIGAVGVMAWLDWRVALIPVLTIPLLPLFAALIGATTADATERRWAALEALSGHFADVVQGIVTLVAYGRADVQGATIRRVSDRLRTTTLATLRLAFLSAAALELLASISVAIVAVFVGLGLAEGGMDLAVGLPLILVAPEAWWPIRRVGVEFHAAADGATAMDGLLALLRPDQTLDDDRDDASSPTGPVHSEVVLRAVVPGHDRPLLRSVDLVASVGLTAVVGPSGIGKTTLLEVIAGVRPPLAGHVSTPTTHLVAQRPFLVAEDIATNLALGLDDPLPPGHVHDLLTAVGLDDVVHALPAGVTTRLGADGVGLSAGQRTRLALARGLASSAPVLAVDEPTAHLDDTAVLLVLAALRAAAGHRVVVVATHDPRVIAAADDVVDLGTRVHPGAVGHRPVPAVEHGPRVEPGPGADAPEPAPVVAPDASTAVDRPADPTASRALSRIAVTPALVGAGVVGGLARACGVALTATSGWLIVSASLEPQLLVLLVAIVLVRAFGIARPVLRWWERVRSHDLALADLADRRSRLWAELVPRTPARLGRRHRGHSLSGLVDDLDDVVSAAVRVVVPAVAIAVAVLVAVVVGSWAGSRVVAPLLTMLVGLATVAVVDLLVERRTQSGLVAARGRVTEVIELVTGSHTDLRGLGRPARTWVDARLEDAQQSLRVTGGRQAWGRAIGLGSTPVVVALATATLAVATQQAVATGLPTPVAALVVLLPLGLGEAIGGDLAAAAGEWTRARAAGARLDDLVRRSPAVTDPGLPAAIPPGPPTLRLDTASATWDEADAPVDLPDLDVTPGTHFGLVGPNGSGKSTTMAVLARHLDPATGHYTVNGVDATTTTLAATRARLALVDDRPHVFASTVRENLRLTRPDATDTMLRSALHTAGLTSWSDTLPAGLDTRVGIGGRGLSGGERSRLAIARAVLSARPVVLLDEPVAHLDHPTALAVMHDVRRAFTDSSMVVAMHRPEGMDDLDVVVDLRARPGERVVPGGRYEARTR